MKHTVPRLGSLVLCLTLLGTADVHAAAFERLALPERMRAVAGAVVVTAGVTVAVVAVAVVATLGANKFCGPC